MNETVNDSVQQETGGPRALAVVMLVLGIVGLVVAGAFGLLMMALSNMGGTPDSEYEAAAYEGAVKAFEEIDRSHFETVEILQDFDSRVILLPTEESWENREELYVELERISKTPHLSRIELIIRDHPEKSVFIEQSVFDKEPDGISPEVWKNLVTLTERPYGQYARYDSFGYWLDGDPVDPDEING